MIARSLLVWLVIIGAEIVHGVARAALLVPRVGDLRARQIGVLTGSILILAIAVAFSRFLGASSRRELLGIGASWLVLTLAFEVLFGRLVMGYSWERLGSDYDPSRGGFLGFGMLALVLAPLLAARIRRSRSLVPERSE